jgi:1,4-dihydroxy-2-naphthoate polyprenyltransferase
MRFWCSIIIEWMEAINMVNYLRISRSQFLIAGLALFAFGALFAVRQGAPFSLSRLLLGYLIILPAHLAVNFSNDYFDVGVDKRDGATPISGGSGVLLEHPELRTPVKWIALALIGCSLGMGLVFLRMYEYPFWMFGFVVIGNLVGWYYSAPPFRLSYRGLGEPAFLLIGGFLLPGMGYLAVKGTLDLAGASLLIPLLLYSLASILSLEIPDMETDRLGEKQTWVARKGRGFGFTIVGICLLAATGYFFLSPFRSLWQVPADFQILGLFSLLPLSVGMFGLIQKPLDREPATRLAILNVISLAVLSLLADSYFVYQMIH